MNGQKERAREDQSNITTGGWLMRSGGEMIKGSKG